MEIEKETTNWFATKISKLISEFAFPLPFIDGIFLTVITRTLYYADLQNHIKNDSNGLNSIFNVILEYGKPILGGNNNKKTISLD